jgi:hypothetical protein
MKKARERIWKPQDPRKQKPEFYLTENEKKDGETSRIRKWLALADRLLDSDEIDPTPSAV